MIKKLFKDSLFVFASKNAIKIFRVLLIIQLSTNFEPTFFGQIMLCFLFIELPEILSFGMTSAIIQKSTNIKDYNLAWTFDKFIIKLFFIIFFISLVVFKTNVELENVFLLLALKVLIEIFENNSFLFLTINLNFKKRILLELPVILGLFLLNIITYLDLLTLNSLLFAYVSIALLRTIISYILYPRFVSFCFDLNLFKFYWIYSKWIFLRNISQKLSENIDSYVFSFSVGLENFGIYQFLKKIAVQLFAQFQSTIDRIMFPLLSRKTNPKLVSQLTKTVSSISIIIMQLIIIVFVILYDKYNYLLSINFSDSKTLLLFLLIGFLKNIVDQNSVYLRSKGESKLEFKLKFLRTLFYTFGLILILNLYGFNIELIALVILISESIVLVLSLFYMKNNFPYRIDLFLSKRILIIPAITIMILSLTNSLEFIPRLLSSVGIFLITIFSLCYTNNLNEIKNILKK